MTKRTFSFVISLILVACTNQASTRPNGIVLGVIRTLLNIPDTYVIGTNGGGTINRYLPANLNSDSEWSPDGSWIISSTQYQVGHPEESAIYLMRSDGSQRRLVVKNKGGSYDPRWSPDGTQIAYYGSDYPTGIYTLNIHCFEHLGQNCSPAAIFLTAGDAAPDWSPDGKQIIYQSKEHIFVINSAGNPKELDLTPSMNFCHDPKWSPNGARILFSCYQPDHFDIFSVNADGSGLLRLTDGVGLNIRPQWSPDGSKIAFISDRNGLGQIIGAEDTIRSNAIFLMDSDGNNVTRLSLRGDEEVLWFAWLPK
jgi:Tol biopolymer transport system component